MEFETHVRNAEENVKAALHAYKMKWNTVVAETAFKAVEQAIEMHAALEGKHMRSHAERIEFADERYPEVAKALRRLRRLSITALAVTRSRGLLSTGSKGRPADEVKTCLFGNYTERR